MKSKTLSETETNHEVEETAYLISVPGMREKIISGMKEELSECVDESAVETI